MDATTMVQLNKYPPDKYNVLIPVTSMQVMSNLQKVVVNEVKLNPDTEKGNDVYLDKQTGKLAITAVGGTKLAAAANISIVYNESEQPDVCKRCVQMAKATNKAQSCGTCPHAYDVKHTVTVRVPEPSGGFRLITKSKEIDCSLEKQTMKEAQYKKFLPHRTSIAETKAYMRCLRAALGLAQGYTKAEIEKPFVIAHIVPNLDAPDIRQALISNSLKDMGMLFEIPTKQTATVPQLQMNEFYEDSEDNYTEGEYQEANQEADQTQDFEEPLPWDIPAQEVITCADCGKEIIETAGKNGSVWTPQRISEYSNKRFGRCLCPDCQKRAKA